MPQSLTGRPRSERGRYGATVHAADRGGGDTSKVVVLEGAGRAGVQGEMVRALLSAKDADTASALLDSGASLLISGDRRVFEKISLSKTG